MQKQKERNGYQNEDGFLHAFTEKERSAIVETMVETMVETKGNALNEGKKIITGDSVFLLSLEELSWFDEAGISKLAAPTEAAIEQDKSKWYQIAVSSYEIEEYCWWLREPAEGTASKAYLVGNGYTQDNLQIKNVGLEGFGIRPAITVDIQAAFGG